MAAKKTASNSLLAVIWGAHRIQLGSHPSDLQTNTTTKQKKCIVFKKKCNFAPIIRREKLSIEKKAFVTAAQQEFFVFFT